jgi:hypothetical protein
VAPAPETSPAIAEEVDSRDEGAGRREHAKKLQDALLSISRGTASRSGPGLRHRGVRLGTARSTIDLFGNSISKLSPSRAPSHGSTTAP